VDRWVWSVTFVAALGFTGATAHAGAVEVKSGDSLWVLAKRHGVSVETIKQANSLKSDDIRAGQTLNIPGGKANKPPAAATAKSAEKKAVRQAPHAEASKPTPKQASSTKGASESSKGVAKAT